MKFEVYTVTQADGTVIEGKVAIPEDLKELRQIYPDKRIYELGLAEYIMKCKRRLISSRARKVVLRFDELSVENQIALRKMGIIPKE